MLYVWGEYLSTRTLIDFPELDTLSVAVSKITGWAALFTSNAFSTYGAEAAAYVVAMVPVLTRHGVPAGILIGFEDPEDWWEETLLRHPQFQARIARAGKVITLEQL
ncbi:hypothetical protein BH10CHL1_BH10CHL1_22990 [soil metagenome]